MPAGRVCAEVPHHITAFFIPVVVEGDPLASGSLGAGLVVDPPARVCASPEGVEAERLGATEGLAAKRLGAGGLRFEAHEPLPRARGYATSASLAVGVALVSAASLGLPVSRALEAAHAAEVEAGTGLGDVVAITSGGYGAAVRLKPGGPGVAVVDYLPPPGGLGVVVAEYGGMTTRELLSAYTERMRVEAERSLRRLEREMTFEAFLEEAQRFSTASGLAAALLGGEGVELVRRTPGLVGFYVKKRLAVLVVEEDRVHDAVEHLGSGGRGFSLRLLSVSGGGPRLRWL
ncbi:GHMP family kinase ATP-binding protein [Stetteria hydrogenophila]